MNAGSGLLYVWSPYTGGSNRPVANKDGSEAAAAAVKDSVDCCEGVAGTTARKANKSYSVHAI